MEPKMTLRQIDCSPSKDGGLTVSLHLKPANAVETEEAGQRTRRRRRRKMTSEQMLELAHSVIIEALENEEMEDTAKHILLGAAASSERESRSQRRLHWPG